MQKKNEQIEFLKGLLDADIKGLLQSEVLYNVSTTLAMSSRGSNDKEVLGLQTKSKNDRDFITLRIRQTRALIEKVEKGEFVP